MQLEEKLYTSTEVAKVLGVSLRSVYRYLEQGKLDAEIKTATGRLRFTKQDILNFLYPDVEESSQGKKSLDRSSKESKSANSSDTDNAPKEGKEDENAQEVPQKDEKSAKSSTESVGKSESPVEEKGPQPPESTAKSADTSEDEEEEIDWLAKFKKAAEEFSVDEEESAKEEDVDAVSALASEPAEDVPEAVYYKSMLGGLKEIAQNIDKIGRKANVDYAFTLYAGLSLEKPLKKPFSLLHVYIGPDSRELFEKMLQLQETDEKNAQVCLITTEEPSVFANKQEKHGLFVVSDEQIKEDFEEFGLTEDLKALI